MYQNLFRLPRTLDVIDGPITLEPNIGGGTHFSSYGVGGLIEVMYLSDLSNDSIFAGISYELFEDESDIRELFLNTENTSCGKRKIGMLVHVQENDTTYQFQFPNYLSSFTAATASTVGTARVVVFEDFQTVIYNLNYEASVLVRGWTNDSIEGINGVSRPDSGWRVFATPGVSPPTVPSLRYYVQDFLPTDPLNVGDRWFNTSTGVELVWIFDGNSYQWIQPAGSIYNVPSSLPFVHLSGDTMTGPLIVPSIDTNAINLGSDSLGNPRVLDADSSVLNNDDLNGGNF